MRIDGPRRWFRLSSSQDQYRNSKKRPSWPARALLTIVVRGLLWLLVQLWIHHS